jgi:hypothetical protein
MSLSVYNSEPKPSKSLIKILNYKFGILQDNRTSDQLPDHIIVVPLAHY